MTAIAITSSFKLRALSIATMLAGLVIAGGGSGIAHAQSSSADRSVVRYADLDLATEQGTRALYLRITAAAEKVCGGRPDMTNPIAVAWSRGCQKKAIDRAVRAVGSPLLAALYATPRCTAARRAQLARERGRIADVCAMNEGSGLRVR